MYGHGEKPDSERGLTPYNPLFVPKHSSTCQPPGSPRVWQCCNLPSHCRYWSRCGTGESKLPVDGPCTYAASMGHLQAMARTCGPSWYVDGGSVQGHANTYISVHQETRHESFLLSLESVCIFSAEENLHI